VDDCRLRAASHAATHQSRRFIATAHWRLGRFPGAPIALFLLTFIVNKLRLKLFGNRFTDVGRSEAWSPVEYLTASIQKLPEVEGEAAGDCRKLIQRTVGLMCAGKGTRQVSGRSIFGCRPVRPEYP